MFNLYQSKCDKKIKWWIKWHWIKKDKQCKKSFENVKKLCEKIKVLTNRKNVVLSKHSRSMSPNFPGISSSTCVFSLLLCFSIWSFNPHALVSMSHENANLTIRSRISNRLSFHSLYFQFPPISHFQTRKRQECN